MVGSLTRIMPVVPPDHPLPIDRRTQGFGHPWAVMANRFRDEWKRKIEDGIAPPQLQGGATIVSRMKISTL